MVGFYDEMQGVAKSVIGEFQQGVIEYIALTPGNGPKDNPGPATEVTTPLEAVARGVSFKYVDKSSVLATDLQTTFAGGGVVPDMKGFIVIDGVRCKIVQIIRKPAAGVAVAWTVIFRK